MSELVDQFCKGISDWSLQTGASVAEIGTIVMVATGGSNFVDVESELFYNPSALTVNDVKNWLERLLSMTHMSDRFLVYSLIMACGSYLDDQFENAAQGSQRVRDAGARIREKIDEPDIIQGIYEMNARAVLTPEKLRERRIKRETCKAIYAPIIDFVNHFGFI